MNMFANFTCQTLRYRYFSINRILLFFCCCALALALTACGEKSAGLTPLHSDSPAAFSPEAAKEGERIMRQYLSLDNAKDSTMKMLVKIQEADGQSRDLQLNVSKKRQADGSRAMLIEFTAPTEERDRNALLTITPQSEIEGMRYIQSNDSFATVKGATNEDSLFGMTAQELADGQPEKYDFRLLGEESAGGKPAYKLEGKLKKGADSKFPRLIMWLDKANDDVLAAEFYDKKNDLARRVNVTKNEQINGHWTRTRWTIDNLARKKRIDFEVKDVKYDQNLSPSIFTPEHLKRTAFK